MYQSVTTAMDKQNYPPPGRLVSINGHRLHIQSDGKGGPTVLLEAGLGSMSCGWGWIQPEVARFTRVVSYDRPGLGWSEPDNSPRTASHNARQLHDLLHASGIEGPYVVVGHSMGGLLVREFADKYPDEVVGMVLVDAAHPDQYWRSPAIKRHMDSGFHMLKNIPLMAKLGLVRITGYLNSQAEGLPVKQREEAEAFLASCGHLETANNEAEAWDSVCSEVRRARKLGGKPLAIVSAGKDTLAGARELQDELAGLSFDSTHVVVRGATHVTLVTHREYALTVVEAIRQVLEKVRKAHNAGRE